ncbi:hypothetical protein BDW59DRAFT_166108 [Aspergillus cavernicola]|uniref:Uncharacterized protein n=1 Tax=Aspergillus cavernicola TaxID=176166 RepID=A0ABR4HNM1_9EURO
MPGNKEKRPQGSPQEQRPGKPPSQHNRDEDEAMDQDQQSDERTGDERPPQQDQNKDETMNDATDDESPHRRPKRYKPPKLTDWNKKIFNEFVQKHGSQIKNELHSENPDFSKIGPLFEELNTSIASANKVHKVKGNPKEEWRTYLEMRRMFHLLNRQDHLPEDGNIPSEIAESLFGERPSDVEELHDDTDSADSLPEGSESEESDSESDEVDGIDALEGRMRKEYSSLSRGKVLYWWPVGMGSQIFVQFGKKKQNPIYRVRAGSSLPYDPRSVPQVLSITRGNAKIRTKTNGMTQETYKYSRDDVQDIRGVGWKVEDDDDTNATALALIRPSQDRYPHTRVLVEWKQGGTTLERRGFIRRITKGGGLAGDRMIYMKAKELENAYWGYDVENKQSNDQSSESSNESSDSEDSLSDQSSRRRTRAKQHSAKIRSKESKACSRESKKLRSDNKQLLKEIKRLTLNQRSKKTDSATRRKSNRH